MAGRKLDRVANLLHLTKQCTEVFVGTRPARRIGTTCGGDDNGARCLSWQDASWIKVITISN